MKMTHEQWNALVALIRAVAVAAKSGDIEDKRQAGKCEASVRQLFVIEG